MFFLFLFPITLLAQVPRSISAAYGQRTKGKSPDHAQSGNKNMDKIVKNLMDYYDANRDDFANDLEKFDNLNGLLRGDRRYPMSYFDELCAGLSPRKIVAAVHYGCDDDGGSFNPKRHYFYRDRFGRLISTDIRDRDYDNYLNGIVVQGIIDNSSNLDLSDGAKVIINGQDA